MRTVFASTTAFLSEEFLTKFEGEKLDWTLSKVAEKSGVKINRINNNISVAGLWPWVLEAHGMLLSDFMGLHRLDEDPPEIEEKVISFAFCFTFYSVFSNTIHPNKY